MPSSYQILKAKYSLLCDRVSAIEKDIQKILDGDHLTIALYLPNIRVDAFKDLRDAQLLALRGILSQFRGIDIAYDSDLHRYLL